MIPVTLLLSLAVAATVDVPAGASLTDALATAKPGDVLRLGPGVHSASLGRRGDLRIEGAGAARTRVVAPPGQDGLVATGRVELSGLTLEAGPARAALKVLGGSAALDGVVLTGEAVAAFVDGGLLDGRDVVLAGGYGLLQADGEVRLRDAVVRATAQSRAGIAVLRGRLELRRASVTGPFAEAAVTVSGGTALLDDVVVRSPGPTGIAVTRGALEGRSVEVAGAREVSAPKGLHVDAALGDCVQVRRGSLRLDASGLARCAGSALTASGGDVRLDGVDAQGGGAGGLVLLAGARGDLRGNWITGRGPALVAASGAQVDATFNRWRADPVFWVECATGARVRLGLGEHHAQPCAPARRQR